MTKYMLYLTTMEDYFPWRQHFMDDKTMTIIGRKRKEEQNSFTNQYVNIRRRKKYYKEYLVLRGSSGNYNFSI